MNIMKLAAKYAKPKAMIWLAGGALAAILSLSAVIGVQSIKIANRDTAIAELNRSIAETTASAERDARKAEREASASIAAATEKFNREKSDAQASYEKVLRDTRIEFNSRLRKRFACPSGGADLRADATASSGSDGPDEAGFGREDAVTAFGIARTGDVAIERLTLCQAYARTCQATCGAH